MECAREIYRNFLEIHYNLAKYFFLIVTKVWDQVLRSKGLPKMLIANPSAGSCEK